MLQESIILGFFINIYSTLALVAKRMSEKSMILAFFRFLKRLSGNLFEGSLTVRIVVHESTFSRNWVHSCTGKIIDRCFNAPVRFLSPAAAKVEHFLKASFSYRLFNVVVDYLHIWIALFFIMAIAIPHASWTNIYSSAAAILFLFLFFLRMVIRNEKQPILMVTDVFLILFFISVLLAAVLSVSPSDSFRFLVFYLTCFVLFVIMALSIRTGEQLTQVINLLLIGVTLSGLYGLWQGIVGVPVNASQVDVRFNEGQQGRIWSTFDNPNNFAEVLILFLPFYLAMAMNSKKLPMRLLYLALSVPCLLSLVLTKSRGDWLGFLVAAAIFVLFRARKFIPLLLVIGLVSIPILPDSIISRFMSIFNMQDSSNKTRLDIYKTIFPMLKDYWITGVGLGADIFKKMIQNYNLYSKMIPNHAHNLFLQIWLETGIIGFLTFIGFLAGLFKRSIKAVLHSSNKSVSNLILAGICGLAAICTAGMADNIWFNPRVMLLFWGAASLLTASLLILSGQDSPEPPAEKRKATLNKAADNEGIVPDEYGQNAVGM